MLSVQVSLNFSVMAAAVLDLHEAKSGKQHIIIYKLKFPMTKLARAIAIGNVESFFSKLEKRTLNEGEVEKTGELLATLHSGTSRQKLTAAQFEQLSNVHSSCAYNARLREILTRIESASNDTASAETHSRDQQYFEQLKKIADGLFTEPDCLVLGTSVLQSVVFENSSDVCSLKRDTVTVGKASYDIGALISALLFAHHRAIADCQSDDSFEKHFANDMDNFCKVLLNSYARVSNDSTLQSNAQFVRELAFVAGCELLQRVTEAGDSLADYLRKDATECAHRALNASTKVDSFGRFLFIVFMYC